MRLRTGCGVVALGLAVSASSAGPTFSVTFVDPAGLLTPWRTDLETAALAGAEVWGRECSASVPLEIVIIANTAIPRATGRSVVSAFNRAEGSLNIADQGTGFELRTGTDPNGPNPDIEINLNPSYVANEFWFDPNPTVRNAPVPTNRLDAISVFSHEIGHAISYNGWINDFDGSFNDNFRSTFDWITEFDGAEFRYIGDAGLAEYGGPIPLTYGNTDHWGNFSPRPGQDLILQMMNGLVYQFGRRYFASRLDRAVLKDTDIPVACEGDFNRNGIVTVQDIFDFLDAYFSGRWTADVNRSGIVTVQDVFDALSAYFVGCP